MVILLLGVTCTFAFRFSGRLYDLGWLTAGLLCGFVIVGLAVLCRQIWILPRILRRVDIMWASGAPVAEVLAVSRPLIVGVGEVGYRGRILRAWAYFACGQRDLAVTEAVSAHLARQSWHIRWLVHGCYRLRAFGWLWPETALIALAPNLPHVCWLRTEKAASAKDDASEPLIWELLLECVPCASDDPLFLDACMTRALNRLTFNQTKRSTPVSGPEARALLERSMTLLMHRHSDPRLPWDRCALANYLLRERRHASVLALCGGLPPAFRSVDLWLVESRTWGELGDIDSAWAAIDAAVRVHPDSHKLWMEYYQIAMARKDGIAARKSLEQAHKYIGKQTFGPDRWEYEMARAEYLFWVEGKSDAAWVRLAAVPEKFLKNRRPRLKAQILLSKASFEEAYKKISDLLTAQPDDTELQIMQAEAMAGMDAWEALLPHLDSMGDNARGRADYWRLKGLTNKHLGSLGQSREDIERAAWMEPFNLRYVIDAGYACVELGEHTRGEQHWRRALKLDSFNREALVRLAESREIHHDIPAAKALLRECLTHHPDFQAAQEMLLRLDTN
ncbi:MAG: hypothetical protein LBH03_01235 [Holophagales bacterium]|nr:hypothetical protein [Holophagales bacterium]